MNGELIPWRTLLTELPSLVELMALLGMSGCLIFVGHLIKGIWVRNNETVPIPVAAVMNVLMLVTYFSIVRSIYTHTDLDHRFSILVWCLIFLAPTAAYYALIFTTAFSNRVIDQISPFNMRIEEPSEFAEARKLALRGDVDGAVKRYRAYLDNTDAAMFEAARLLKSEDRYAEAAALFLEISERYFGKKLVWAEATFHLAKLRESHLHQAKDAMNLLGQILERASDTRFGQLAQTELTRMQSLYTIDPNESVDYSEPDDGEDPFYAEGHVRTAPVSAAAPEDNGRKHTSDMHDLPAPAVDPFFAAAMKRAQEDEEAEAAAQAAKPAPKKSPAKKAAAKKTPAKRKPKAAE